MSDRQAAIHDLGYQRYIGGRRSQGTRWQVIVRNMLSMSWKGWWRYKMPLVAAFATMVGIGVGIYFSRNSMFVDASPDGGNQIRTIADSLIPQSYTFFSWSSLLICLTILASTISRDLKAGAFEFYFSRPVRPMDYVLGKLGGAFFLLAPILLVAPFLLTIYRLGLTGDIDRTVETLSWLPRSLLVGFLVTLAQASVALAFGAITRKPRTAIVGYGAFILVFGLVVSAISHGTQSPELAALNLNSAITGLSSGVFEVDFLFGSQAPSLTASLISILGYITVSISLIMWRVRAAQRAGMGGG
ncbi:MAG: ABC transporter permease subunit [Myxococcales bacterium]|nr:ABC transporter permease subunit [Myxococcales bacterium]